MHVGMPKTGTSALQYELFRFLPSDFEYVGRGMAESQFRFIYSDLLWIRENNITTEILKSAKSNFVRAAKRCKAKTLLISYEGISGSFLLDEDEDVFPDLMKYLCNVLDSFEVMVSFRRLDEFVESMYLQRVKKGYFSSFDEFVITCTDYDTTVYSPYNNRRRNRPICRLLENHKNKISLKRLDVGRLKYELSDYAQGKLREFIYSREKCVSDYAEDLGLSHLVPFFQGVPSRNISCSSYSLKVCLLVNRLLFFIFKSLSLIGFGDDVLFRPHRRLLSITVSLQQRFDLWLVDVGLYKRADVLPRDLRKRLIQMSEGIGSMKRVVRYE